MSEATGSIRPGEISAIYPDRATARVLLPDLKLVTAECPILYPACVKSHDYRMPEVGESVLVAFLGTGIETGFILGSFYNAKDVVPVSSSDIRHWGMTGGGALDINRSTREVCLVDSYGSRIVMRGGNIIIKAANSILLNPSADVSLSNHLAAIFNDSPES